MCTSGQCSKNYHRQRLWAAPFAKVTNPFALAQSILKIEQIFIFAYLQSMDLPITAHVHHDGKWLVAFCPEFPEANGQGESQAECLESLH